MRLTRCGSQVQCGTVQLVNNNYITQQFVYKLMYKLWRRELSKPSTSDQSAKRKEAELMELLTQMVKHIRKKEQLFIKALFAEVKFIQQATSTFTDKVLKNNGFSGGRQHTSSGVINSEMASTDDDIKVSSLYQLQNELQNLVIDEDDLLVSIKGLEEEPFFLNKAYLYTLLVRLLEILDFARQRVTLRTKNGEQVHSRNWDKLYDENKLAITESYQNLVYFQNFNVYELISIAIKKQNSRIFSIVPSKTKKNHITLKPLIRLNSTEIKRSHSIEVKPKMNDVNQIINKKLLLKEKKMETQKRVEERKRLKQRPVILKALYGILGVKVPKIEQGNAFMREVELEALERNEAIREERKKWEKRCEQRQYSLKLIGEYT